MAYSPALGGDGGGGRPRRNSASSSAKAALPKPRTVKIDRGSLIDDNVIGIGCYATVYRVHYNGRDCTVKKIHRILYQGVKNAIVKERFRDECALLSHLSHPNVVHFIGVSEAEAKQVLLVTEWLPADLRHVMDQCPDMPLSVKLSLLQDVSYGLLYLHSMKPDPIVHRDLTASNVLVTRDLRAKIADLGMARALNVPPRMLMEMTKCPGAMAYMPPEALQETPVYGTALDIFSFGQLSLFVVNQVWPDVIDVPVKGREKGKGVIQLKKREGAMKLMEEGNPDHHCMKELITHCLSDHPQKRPSAEMVCETMHDLCSLHPKSLSVVTDVCSVLYEQWGVSKFCLFVCFRQKCKKTG